MQTNVENATNILVRSVIKATRLSNSVGYLKLADKGRKTQRMKSTCRIPSVYAQLKLQHSQIYYCELAGQDLCFDFMQDLWDIRA